MGVLLGLSAFFSGSETALFSLSKVELRRFFAARGSIARAIAFCAREPSDFLSTVLFCNMLVNILFYSLSASLSIEMAKVMVGSGPWQHSALLLISLITLLLVIIFGEVTPKSLAVLAPASFLRFSALPMAALHWTFRPVRGLLQRVTRLITLICQRQEGHRQQVEELNLMLESLAAEGDLSRNDSSMVSEVIDFPQVRLREFMTPRVGMEMAPAESSCDELLGLGRKTGQKWIPLFEEYRDEVVGVADLRQLLLTGATGSVRAHLIPPAIFSEYCRADTALRRFQKQGLEVGLVVDEYGGTAGLVTLQQLLAQIFHDCQEEGAETAIERLGEGRFLLSGGLSVRELFDWLPRMEALPAAGTTVAGLVSALLGHVPELGESVTAGRIRFTVREVVRHHAASVELELLPEDEDGEGAV
ncbi:MAG: hemolysin family protein [Planctomycetota bacterium]